MARRKTTTAEHYRHLLALLVYVLPKRSLVNRYPVRAVADFTHAHSTVESTHYSRAPLHVVSGVNGYSSHAQRAGFSSATVAAAIRRGGS